MTPSETFTATFRMARKVGTSLMGINTADPAATIERLVTTSAATVPVVVWDACRGWRPANEPGKEAIREALRGSDPSATVNPIECLSDWAPNLPRTAILCLVHAHRYLSDGTASGAAFVQALWNLRDAYKRDLRTVVLLAPQITLPGELVGDVFLMDEPLADDLSLAAIVTQRVAQVTKAPPGQATLERAVDALRGLAAFPAEQATAMATTEAGLDLETLWERKRRMISATPGLTVWRGGDTLDDVGGCEQVKRYITMKAQGRQPFRAVVFIDEGEKMLAGATNGAGDSSGVSQDFLGVMLTQMQDWNDRGSSGMLFVGPPGAAKSMVAKAAGASFGVPTIQLDAGGMKASLVGESEARIRQAMKVIDAVGGGRVLVIMTCNKVVSLPPELRRRFTAGTFYFDLPDAAEQAVIWRGYMAKYGLKKQPLPPAKAWTGAEIKQACVLAWDLGLPLRETPGYIVPVAVSAAEDIRGLRRQADRRFLSASRPGLYEAAASDDTTTERPGRSFATEEV